MTTIFKPMLSATCEDIATLRYPVLVSPKLDGVRCLIRQGIAVSRNLKPIPNAFIQRCLKGLPDGLDGELIVGKPVGDDVWNRSQSGVMKATGEPDFTYWVFDWCNIHDQFQARLADARLTVEDIQASDNAPSVKIVPHMYARDYLSVTAHEQLYVEQGYEGIMIRDPNGKYKFGRSTVKEGGLLKLKRWHDAEAVVVDFVERQHNGNEATKDELGRTKRSTAKAGKTGRGDLGALVCTMPRTDFEPVITTFELGTGFTDEERAAIWDNRDKHKRKLVTFKYQQLTPDGVPRFPVFKGFRDARDMST